MSDASSLYIVDTNIIIDLWDGGLLAAFFRLPYQIASPDVVIAELHRPEGSRLVELGLQSLTLEADLVQEVIALRSKHKSLSTPDLFAFVATRSLDVTLLTGDAGLRQLAEAQQVPVYGILWVLDEMVRIEIISTIEAADSLERMLKAGSRLPEIPSEERLRRWRKP